jgi:hypothetical protein
MTIQITLSGHADNADAEGNMLDAVVEAVNKMRESGQVYSASASTSHHGGLDLIVCADEAKAGIGTRDHDWSKTNAPALGGTDAEPGTALGGSDRG